MHYRLRHLQAGQNDQIAVFPLDSGAAGPPWLAAPSNECAAAERFVDVRAVYGTRSSTSYFPSRLRPEAFTRALRPLPHRKASPGPGYLNPPAPRLSEIPTADRLRCLHQNRRPTVTAARKAHSIFTSSSELLPDIPLSHPARWV